MPSSLRDIDLRDGMLLQAHARRLFLKAIRAEAYQVLEHLFDLPVDENTPDKELIKNVDRFLRKYYLQADFLRQAAFQALMVWRRSKLTDKFIAEFKSSDLAKSGMDFGFELIFNEFADPIVSVSPSSFLAKELFDRGIPHSFRESLSWLPENVAWEIPIDVYEMQPPVGFPPWAADRESYRDYICRVREKINVEISADRFPYLQPQAKSRYRDAKLKFARSYCDDVLRRYLNVTDSDGNPVWRRTATKKQLTRDASWAVKYQILGEDYSSIQFESGTVKKAVDRFLLLIELPARKSPRGRRSGQTKAEIERQKALST